MLTPAEELGLSGKSLSGRVRQAFYDLGAGKLRQLVAQIKDECLRRHVVYLRDGNIDPVRVLPCPLTVLPDQLGYVHYISLTMQNALKRLPEMYRSDPRVRTMLQVSDAEEEWLWDCWGPSHADNNPVFGRLDAVVDFSSPMWKESLKFVEPNMSGIGGLHLTPMAEQIIADLVFPMLKQYGGGLRLQSGHDMRELFMQEVLDHMEAIGRPKGTVCFVEPKYCNSGIDEQEDLASFYQARHGIRVLHADPLELELRDDEVFYAGEPIDVLYRDYSVLDLIELQQSGGNVEPMRKLFRENRVISSVAAELDQKNCWEVLTDPQVSRDHFSAEERQVFRRHVLWTRRLCASHHHTSGRRAGFAVGLRPLRTGIAGDQAQPVLRRRRRAVGTGLFD